MAESALLSLRAPTAASVARAAAAQEVPQSQQEKPQHTRQHSIHTQFLWTDRFALFSSWICPEHQVTLTHHRLPTPRIMETNSQFSLQTHHLGAASSRATMVVCMVSATWRGLSSLCPDSPMTTGLEVDISSTLSGNMTSGGIRRSSLSRKTMQRPMSVQELSSTTNKPPRKRASVSFAPNTTGAEMKRSTSMQRSSSATGLVRNVSVARSWGSGDIPLTASQTELLRRLAEPSMITGTDMPRARVTLSGGEKEQRPVSESMQLRMQRRRFT